MAVLAELGATDPIEGAAPKRLKSFNAAQRLTQRIERRRYIITDPVRDLKRSIKRYEYCADTLRKLLPKQRSSILLGMLRSAWAMILGAAG